MNKGAHNAIKRSSHKHTSLHFFNQIQSVPREMIVETGEPSEVEAPGLRK